MVERRSSKSVYSSIKSDKSLKTKLIDERIKREEKYLEDEINELSKYILNKLEFGLDLFKIQLPDTLYDLKKIILYIFNKAQRKQTDNIVIRQYLISFPDFMETLKLKEEISGSKELLIKISQNLKKEEIPKDKVIFYNGQLGKSFYLILEGEVSVIIPSEFKVKITDVQLFKYMGFLLQHRDYELIRLILESNINIINDNEYGENEAYLKFKSVVDKALPSSLETENINTYDYIKRYNFFEDIQNKNILKKLKKLKKEKEKDEEEEKINDDKNKDKNKIKGKDKENNKDHKEGGDSTRRKSKNYLYNIERNFTVWKYFEVCRLTPGKCFGELALQKEGKKRNATIITNENCVFGILYKDAYQMFIKETMDKARKINVELLLKSKLFRGCNNEKFESHFFGCFKFVKKNKGEYLFRQGEKRSYIYFIKKGEVQIELYSSCANIDNIVENLGYPNDDFELTELIKSQKKLEKFCQINRKFNVLIFSGDIIGLSDHTISDTSEEFAFSGYCASFCELFVLDKEFYNKLMEEKIIRNNCAKMVKERKERLAERLLILRSNVIYQYYNNYIKENSKDIKEFFQNHSIINFDAKSINKKKEYKKPINQENKGDTGYNNNINTNYNTINNNYVEESNNNIESPTFKNKYENSNNLNRTLNSFFKSNNKDLIQNKEISQNLDFIQKKNSVYFQTNQKDKLEKTEINFYKSKTKQNSKRNIKNKSSIKALNLLETIQVNKKLKEDSKTNNFNMFLNKIQDENNIIKSPKVIHSYMKNDGQTQTIATPRYNKDSLKKLNNSVKGFINDDKKISASEKKSKSINTLNSTKNYINLGHLKMQKLLLKQALIYNTKIDKIDKIIINNYEKISPMSCKLLINKKKNKDKKFEAINESNFNLTQMERKKEKYFSVTDKDKIYKSFADNYESQKNKKINNIFSLPSLETDKNKNNKNSNNQVFHLKEMWNIFKNKKLKSINVSP